MKRKAVLAGTAVLAVALLLTPGVRAEEVAFYAPGPGLAKKFRGKIVCLSCPAGKEEDLAECQKNGHRHALRNDADGKLYPLLARNAEMLGRIHSADLHGKEVTMEGRYYEKAGVVLVDAIAPVIVAPLWGPHGGHK
ncbi:MAG: hypothetical protein KatS3mg076_3285 [Candidatus Binatia bacterium]|nr:MAG: hypothetical protein KatS3mg076_3285 [Candidatus Binatia bacterium]